MATRYVSFDYGLDTNNGAGSDPTHATNKPWKTLAKALGAAGIASGDRVEICPGVQREVVTVAMTSATAETIINGDYGNASGFRDGSGVLVPPGPVTWSAWTTSDLVAGSATACVVLAGRDFLTFQGITFLPYTGAAVNATTATSVNITLRDCGFVSTAGSNPLVDFTNAADVALHLLIERCVFLGNGAGCLRATLSTSAVADYDADIVIRNVRLTTLVTTGAAQFNATGAGAFKAGGGLFDQCTVLSGTTGILVFGANHSLSIPCVVRSSWFSTGGTAIFATTLGQLVEDYNVIHSGAPRSGVAVGANSRSGNPALHAPRVSIGQEALFGFPLAPFLSPLAGSPLLGFIPSGLTPAAPTDDQAGQTRPIPGSVGAFEVFDVPAGGAAPPTTGQLWPRGAR